MNSLSHRMEERMGFGPIETVPTMIGKYRLLAELGRGGMARVYLAVAHGPSGFSKLVVLKMIRAHLAEDADSLRMFLDEARLAGRLSHPNVVHTLEVAELEGRHFIVMEYLEGQSFASILRRAHQNESPVPIYLQLRGLVDALQGLHYAHELKDFDGTLLNLIHRDVSPQNIIVTYDGQVKMLDFGIAKAISLSSDTKAGVIKGKVAYMAPEQFLGEKLDRRVDIYSMGAVLWQTATGTRMWRGVPDGQVIHRVIRGDVPTPSSVNPDVHPELERISLKALSRDRDKRYSNCVELQEDLEALIEQLGGKVTSRQFGSVVGTMFSDVRKKIDAIVESQLSKAQSYDVQAFDQTTIPALVSTWQTGSIALADGSNQFSSPKFVPSTGSGSLSFCSSPSNSIAMSNSIPTAEPVARGQRKAWLLITAVVALFVGFGAALWLAPSLRGAISDNEQQYNSAAAPPVVIPSVIVSSPVSEDASKPREIEIKISTEPTFARIFFDGLELATNPATRRVQQSAQVYKIRVQAKGYRSREVEVPADDDVSVHVVLDRVEVIRRASAKKAQPPKEENDPPPSADPPAPPPPEEPNARDRIHNLDKTNPWEN